VNDIECEFSFVYLIESEVVFLCHIGSEFFCVI